MKQRWKKYKDGMEVPKDIRGVEFALLNKGEKPTKETHGFIYDGRYCIRYKKSPDNDLWVRFLKLRKGGRKLCRAYLKN